MAYELLIDVIGLQIFPEQDLEGKIGYIGEIDGFYETGKGIGAERIRVSTISCNSGRSLLDLSYKDFREFLHRYKIEKERDLIGKPVISVYTRSAGVILSGLVPINLDRE